MAENNRTPRVIVLGMGNVLLKDEGIGVHVAQALQESPLPVNMELEIIDGGTLPGALPSGEVDRLIVVDAVQGGDEAGAIYRFCPRDIKMENEMLTSLHQMNLLEELWMAERFGQKPKEVIIIGVEPEDMSLGLELSDKLRQRLPRIIEVVMEEIALNYPDDSEKGDLRK